MIIPFSIGGSSRAGMLALVVCLGFLVVACAPPTKPVDLKRAEAAVEQAQTDPSITRYAPVKLDEAEEALQRARVAWEKDKSGEEVDHLAYLAQQRAAIAEKTAAEKAAQAEIKDFAQERQQMLVEVRELEAKQAREQAKMSEEQAEMAEGEVRELKQRLEELKAKETKRGYVVTLGDILFEVDRAELTPGGMQNLFRLVTFLKEFPDREIVVEGHTDSTGSGVYNQELSQQRANTVRNFLINNGIATERIVARGYGEDYPVAPNDTAAGRQQNRRVEIVILHAGEQAEEYRRSG